MRLALVCVFLVLVAACGGGDDLTPGNKTPTPFVPTPDPAFSSLLSRSLNLPSISSGTCPVTPSELLSPTLPMTLGNGPVYAEGLGSDSTMHISDLVAGSDWPGSTISFAAQPGFTGLAVVRGKRLDASGAMGFDDTQNLSTLPSREDLELAQASASDQWGYWSAYVRVQQPGCYGFQVDTDSGSEEIVFNVVVGRQ